MNFFERFTEVGNRVDKYLNNQYEGGFEQKIKNFQTQPLTEETAKENLKDLQAIENLKEKCRAQASGKVVHIMVGKTMEEVVRRIRREEDAASGSIPVKFIIDGVEDTDLQSAMLNSLQEAINTENIEFKNATQECIILHVLIKKGILQDDDLMTTEVIKFIEQVYEIIDLRGKPGEDLTVVMTSDEDDVDSSSILVCADPTVKKDVWSGGNSLVLNVDIKNKALRSSETLNESIGQFISNILSITNGSGFIKQKEFSVILEPGDIDFSQSQGESPRCVTFLQQSDDTRLDSTEILLTERLNLSDQLGGTNDTHPEKGNDNDEKDATDSEYAKAQCHMIPKPLQPWKFFLGFKKLIELKEKGAEEIVSTFYRQKIYLTAAMNDENMPRDKDIIVMFLRCFAKCAKCESLSSNIWKIYEILDDSSFLTKSVVNFVADAVSVSKVAKENYYRQSLKDLLDILLKLKTLEKLKSIPPVTTDIFKRLHILKDIFDEDMLQKLEILKMIKDPISLKTESTTDSDKVESQYSHQIEYERSYSERVLRQPQVSTYHRSTSDSRLGLKDKGAWKIHFGFRRLRTLKDAEPDEIVSKFVEQITILKDALDDDDLIHNKDVVAFFLRCFSKCLECASRQNDCVTVFRTMRYSVFMKDHVRSFIQSMAIGQYQRRIIPPKETIKDILAIFDSFNSLVPEAVPFVHVILMDVDTAMNAIKTQTNWMDDDMWRKYHTLMDRRTATSPVKRQ